MRFLIDTNVLIPLEPTSRQDLAREDPRVSQLARTIGEAGHVLCLHPDVIHDVRRNGDTDRRSLREILIRKYPTLRSAPSPSQRLQNEFGSPAEGSSEWVDNQLLAAIEADAVDYLITDDRGIHRKAARLDLRERVLTTAEAIELVSRLFDRVPLPPPAVDSRVAYELRVDDPIFESLRQDYDGFDDWLSRARREQRQTWVIPARDEDVYAALCIVNQETDARFTGTRTLKLCTFKVSEEHSGLAYGELLLRTVFDYADLNDYSLLYMTVFPKHEGLIHFLGQFGFAQIGANDMGEYEYIKPLGPQHDADQPLSRLEYHIRYGPYEWEWSEDRAWIVPIRPRYHQILFPDAEIQRSLLPGERPSGNSIRKAYLCRAGTRAIQPGDVILFYRSEDAQSVTVVGVLEDAMVSGSPDAIASHVGKRTVYTYDDICAMCGGGEVLSLLFRYAHSVSCPIHLTELEQEGFLISPPQSIQRMRRGNQEWLLTRLRQR